MRHSVLKARPSRTPDSWTTFLLSDPSLAYTHIQTAMYQQYIVHCVASIAYLGLQDMLSVVDQCHQLLEKFVSELTYQAYVSSAFKLHPRTPDSNIKDFADFVCISVSVLSFIDAVSHVESRMSSYHSRFVHVHGVTWTLRRSILVSLRRMQAKLITPCNVV